MKAVLIATIGTRDLMFQVSSGFWYNLGNDRMKDGDEFGEQFEVLSDLGLGSTTYRDLTQYLLEGVEIYREKIKPVIIGKLLNDKAAEIDKIYLIGTNQNLAVREREKDTLYACGLIKNWVEDRYQVPVEILHLGTDGTNPANFEQMFAWWRDTWRNQIEIQTNQPVWICLKGGVGQTSEAARVSGLSLFGENIQFFEFTQNSKANRAGVCSEYSEPFLGTNYLWDRTQQQALNLLERYDYAEVLDLLAPYFKQDTSSWGAVPSLVKAGLAWNHGEFQTFFQLAKSYLSPAQINQEKAWWWMAYEQAYLGVVRLKQQNTTEAMLHTYRSVEGALYLWAIATFSNNLQEEDGQYPLLLKSICQQYPAFTARFTHQKSIPLKGDILQDLLATTLPKTASSIELQAFWRRARKIRNFLSHRLGGITEREVFTAWGQEVKDKTQWENRVLCCLNLVTEQHFKSLSEASIFFSIHLNVLTCVRNYRIQAMKNYIKPN